MRRGQNVPQGPTPRDGDGFDDVVVGAPNFDYDRTGEGDGFIFLGIGGVKVYLGSPTGPSSTAGWSEDRRETASYFGISVGTAGLAGGPGQLAVRWA